MSVGSRALRLRCAYGARAGACVGWDLSPRRGCGRPGRGSPGGSGNRACWGVLMALGGVQNAKGAQRGNGQWVPDYAASPNHACLKRSAGALGYPFHAYWATSHPSPPTDLRGRHLPTTPRERSWTENQRRKSESVQTATAHAQNLYWTSAFFAFYMVLVDFNFTSGKQFWFYN